MNDLCIGKFIHTAAIVLELVCAVIQFLRENLRKPGPMNYVMLVLVYLASILNFYTTWWQGFAWNLVTYIFLALVLTMDCVLIGHVVGTIPAIIVILTGLSVVIIMFIREKLSTTEKTKEKTKDNRRKARKK